MAKKTVDPAMSAAAAAMGRVGGSRRVPKGFSALTAEERSTLSKDAAKARWAKPRAAKPAKAPAAKKRAAGKKARQ